MTRNTQGEGKRERGEKGRVVQPRNSKMKRQERKKRRREGREEKEKGGARGRNKRKIGG
jgi:hypothetical protein